VVKLEYESFLSLREGAEVVEADGHGEKVLLLRDGTYLKLFRRKRLLSSAVWYPYAQRFSDNAEALTARGIPCPAVVGVYWLPAISRDAVHYRPVAGQALRQLVAVDSCGTRLRFEFGAFVAKLHGLGVYFRSLHLGNVILMPGGDFGLIDLADLRFARGALGKRLVERNMRHLFRLPGDRSWLSFDGGRAFISGYRFGSGRLPAIEKNGFADLGIAGQSG